MQKISERYLIKNQSYERTKLVETNGRTDERTDERTQPLLELTPQGGQLKMIKGDMEIHIDGTATHNIIVKTNTTWYRSFAYKKGYCYTLNHTIKPIFQMRYKILMQHGNFDIFLHDPRLYHFTELKTSLPMTKEEIYVGYFYWSNSLYVRATKHFRINRPKFECNVKTGYSFTSCIRNYVVAKIGCR